MRSLLKLGIVISFAASLSACATSQRPQNYIDAAARPLIKDMDSVLIAPQKSLKADIKI